MSAAAGPFGPDAELLVEIRRDMLRFAKLQLRDDQLAEDVVQEAIAAALASQQGFAGRSALKTWVFTILRNKIVDEIRQRSRTVALGGDAPEDDDLDQALDALFKANGHWRPDERPADWGDPEAALRERQFWTVFEACLDALPANTARVFMMREFLELDTGEICRELRITASNCHVILHRARSGLRRCLEHSWFAAGAASC